MYAKLRTLSAKEIIKLYFGMFLAIIIILFVEVGEIYRTKSFMTKIAT